MSRFCRSALDSTMTMAPLRSIFVFFSVVVAEYDGYCGALTPGCTGSRTRAVLKSESQGCPACTIVEWN
ncbi:hypothetical protein BGY98DRAFT_1015950, partial [Russula aff. rugulosa BPL654]